MTFTEIHGNLFECVQKDIVYAHCIAQDDNYGAGIAPVFIKFFKIKNKLSWELEESILKGKTGNQGFCILIGNAANLITKNNTYAKPTYHSITNALMDMKDQMVKHSFTKLCIPKIGCGLDCLLWGQVRETIQDVFKDTNIDIVVKIK